MIRGVGLELVDVAPYERFLAGESAGEPPGAGKDWFSEGELAYCRRRADGAQHLAARHAAKVATLRALGHEDTAAVRDVIVERAAGGRPYLVLRPGTVLARIARGVRLHLSMSHSGGHAVALVVADTQRKDEHNGNL